METMEDSLRHYDCERIEKKFSKACETYDHSAVAQKLIVQTLSSYLKRLLEENNFYPVKALEIGCGTGLFTEYLQDIYPLTEWTLNDLSKVCLQHALEYCAKETISFCGDVTKYKWTNHYNLIASSSVFQWLPCPESLILRLSGIQSKGDVLIFSTFLPGNLIEIQKLTQQGIQYPSETDWLRWLQPSYQVLDIKKEEIPLFFSSPREVLLHLRNTGVTANSSGVWTPGKYREFCNDYSRYFSNENNQVKLTYKPLYVVAIKK